jgi:hypothetical protein
MHHYTLVSAYFSSQIQGKESARFRSTATAMAENFLKLHQQWHQQVLLHYFSDWFIYFHSITAKASL